MMKNPMPELTPLLSKLKLSGISESLARRNKEAIDNKLSYLEFFGLLLQDEILRRENKQFAKRIKQSGFRGDKTIENFDFNFNPKLDQQLIKDLATCRFLYEKVSVFIVILYYPITNKIAYCTNNYLSKTKNVLLKQDER